MGDVFGIKQSPFLLQEFENESVGFKYMQPFPIRNLIRKSAFIVHGRIHLKVVGSA